MVNCVKGSTQVQQKSTVSKAALRSSRTKTETLRASVFRRISFVTLISAVSVLWWGLKPDWKVSKALIDRRKSESCWYTTFSRTLPKNGRFDMGRYNHYTTTVRLCVDKKIFSPAVHANKLFPEEKWMHVCRDVNSSWV